MLVDVIQKRLPIWVPPLLCLGVLAFDAIMTPGVAIGLAYLPLILCSLWFSDKYASFWFALTASGLLLLGAFIAPLGYVETWIVVMNRLLTACVLWFVAALVYWHKQSEAEQKINEAELHKVQRLLSSIVSSSMDPILSKNMDGIITSWNNAAEQLFGYASEEVIGKHIGIIIPPDRMSEEHRIIAQIKAGIKLEHFETKRLRKNGQLVDVSLTVSPIRGRHSGLRFHVKKRITAISKCKQKYRAPIDNWFNNVCRLSTRAHCWSKITT